MDIAFIGGGNMATALIAGLARSGTRGEQLRVCDPDPGVRERLVRDFELHASNDPASCVPGASVVVLAVKPQVAPAVLERLSRLVATDQLLLSVAAGTTVATIRAALGEDQAVVRGMPNTPALVGKGVTGLYATPGCTTGHRELAETVMAAAGVCVWVEDESLMDVVTAVSGSGPAYFYLLIEALREAGTALGLPPAVAAQLATHTAHGAGVMALESGTDVSELRRRVTSPGGTTQAAIEALQAGGFHALVAAAVQAATERGQELAGGTPGP